MQATSSETRYQSHVKVLPTTAGLAWITWCHGDDGDETGLMTSWRLVITMTTVAMVVIVRRRRRTPRSLCIVTVDSTSTERSTTSAATARSCCYHTNSFSSAIARTPSAAARTFCWTCALCTLRFRQLSARCSVTPPFGSRRKTTRMNERRRTRCVVASNQRADHPLPEVCSTLELALHRGSLCSRPTRRRLTGRRYRLQPPPRTNRCARSRRRLVSRSTYKLVTYSSCGITTRCMVAQR
jgi:hypothetical protein